MSIKRMYHNYNEWEDYQNGMYEKPKEVDYKTRMDCQNLLADDGKLYNAMNQVIWHWKKAAEVALSNPSRNKQAWLGQAACCFIYGADEFTTKEAWNQLDQESQRKANISADRIYDKWRRSYES